MQSEQPSKLKDELAGPLRVMQEAARRIAKIAIESKLSLVEGLLSLLDSFFFLIDTDSLLP